MKESKLDGIVGDIFGNGEAETEDCEFASSIRRSSHTVFPLIIYQFIEVRDTNLLNSARNYGFFIHLADELI